MRPLLSNKWLWCWLIAACYCCCGFSFAAAAHAAPPAAGTQQQRFMVTATAYNSVRAQTDGTPFRGAWGDRLDRLPPGLRGIAVSADLVKRGLKRHERVRIKGMAGEFMVVDRAPARWKNRIDIYMGKDVGAARKWGRRRVEIVWERRQPSGPPAHTKKRRPRR